MESARTAGNGSAWDSASMVSAAENIETAMAFRLPIRSARYPPRSDATSAPTPYELTAAPTCAGE